MSGTPGMKKQSDAKAIRRSIWRSIRILRRFTMPDLQRTVPGATEHNIRRYVRGLLRHGYIATTGTYRPGRPGALQSYSLVKDTGAEHPTRCDRCGKTLADFQCQPEARTTGVLQRTVGVSHDAA